MNTSRKPAPARRRKPEPLAPSPVAAATMPDDIAHADLVANATVARVTGGISPSSVGGAYADWLAHLAMSPAKRIELLNSAWSKAGALARSVAAEDAEGAESAQVTGQLPGIGSDKRFADPAWQRWPFNQIAGAFMQREQWWREASSNVRGMSRHHAEVVDFTNRQWLDFFAPSISREGR